MASPTVVADGQGKALGGFPSLTEIEAVENYVYGAVPPTLEELRQRANGRPLGIVVFAPQYQNTPMSVHSRHAELCFARSGIARLGTIEPFYDRRARGFAPLDETRPFDFRVVPRRFAAYLAVKMQGASGAFGPQDPLPEDKDLAFWVPVHKLFSGSECIEGLDLHVELRRGLRNDGLAQFHRFLDAQRIAEQLARRRPREFSVRHQGRDDRIALGAPRTSVHGMLEPRPIRW